VSFITPNSQITLQVLLQGTADVFHLNNKPKEDSQCFPVNLHPKHSLQANLLLPLGILFTLTIKFVWGRKLVRFTGTLSLFRHRIPMAVQKSHKSRGLAIVFSCWVGVFLVLWRETEREKLTERWRVVHLGPTFVDTLPLFELVAGFQPRGVGCFRHTSRAKSKAMHPTKKKRRR
jgi:hypothetical protein